MVLWIWMDLPIALECSWIVFLLETTLFKNPQPFHPWPFLCKFDSLGELMWLSDQNRTDIWGKRNRALSSVRSGSLYAIGYFSGSTRFGTSSNYRWNLGRCLYSQVWKWCIIFFSFWWGLRVGASQVVRRSTSDYRRLVYGTSFSGQIPFPVLTHGTRW